MSFFFPPWQVLHHLWLIKGHSTGQRSSHRDVRKDTLDCVNLLPLLLGQFCLVPLPSVPYTYPITRCLSPALTSSFAHLCCWWFQSLAAFLHPRRISMCSRSSPPPPPWKHIFPSKVFSSMCGVALSLQWL